MISSVIEGLAKISSESFCSHLNVMRSESAVGTFANKRREMYSQQYIFMQQFEGGVGMVEIEEERVWLKLIILTQTECHFVEVDFASLVYVDIQHVILFPTSNHKFNSYILQFLIMKHYKRL